MESAEEHYSEVKEGAKATVKETPNDGKRATSRARQVGYEPFLEKSEEKDVRDLKACEPQSKIHRESRSRALKREIRHGVSKIINCS